jgi:protein-disulfide isomerase
MRRSLLTAMLLLATASAGRAQAPTAKARDVTAASGDLTQIKADLEIVKTQLAQVLRLLNQRPAQGGTTATGPARAIVGDAPALGRADAPVTIVEFSDYQCPFCQRFFASTLPALKTEYIDAGKVRYVFRDYPIDQLHPQARKAAEAAHCAGDQGKYWEMHDILFQNQSALALPQLTGHAQTLGLDARTFDECLSSGVHAARVNRGVADAAAAGVQGTPGFVIGKTTASDAIVGTTVRGARPIETFRQIIDRALAQSGAVAP